MRLLYVHGYNGNPYGDSYQNLKVACGDIHELFTIDYDCEHPDDAIRMISRFVKEDRIDVVIGASLGGFLTMNLYGVSRIVVNPCWNPAKELPMIGFTGDIDVYFHLLNAMKESLDSKEKSLCSGVFANDDELLGSRYVDVFQTYFERCFHIDGGHRIDANMAKEIVDKILPIHERETALL